MSKHPKNHLAKFESAFHNYLDAYMTGRDLKLLKAMVTKDFCGYGTGLDENFYSRDRGLEIFERDIASAPDTLHYTLQHYEIKLLDKHNAIVVSELDLKTVIMDQDVYLNNLRMMMVLHEEDNAVKISAIHISFPTEAHAEDESYPIKELEERNKVLNRMVEEKTKNLKQAEKEREKISAKYEMVLQNTQDAMFLVEVVDDETFRFIHNNNSHAQATGLETKEIRGKTPQEVVGEEMGAAIVENYKRCVQERESISYEETLDLPGGKRTWSTILTLVIEDEEVSYIVGSSRDMTEHKQMEQDLKQSKEKLSSILNNMEDVVWSISFPDFKHEYLSPSLEKLYGRSAQEFYENPTLFKEVTHPEDRHLTEKAIEQLLEEGEAERECRVVRPDGSIVWINDRSKVIYDDNHQPIKVDGVTRDITEQKKAEKQLKFQMQFETLVSNILSYFVSLSTEHIDEGINYTLQEAGKFFDVDRSYIFKLSEDAKTISNTHEWCQEGIESQIEVLQNKPFDVLPEWTEKLRSHKYLYVYDVQSLLSENEITTKEFMLQDIQSLLCIPIVIEGSLFGFIGFDALQEKCIFTKEQIELLKVIAEIISNAFARKLAAEKILHFIFHDSLTGLYNRAFAEEDIKRLDTERQLPLSIIIGDVNGLKFINDAFGHEKGDELLRKTADILQQTCRKEDIIARWGGDEFIILLPQTNKEDAETICSRIQDICSKTKMGQLSISIALGYATKKNPEQDIFEIRSEADKCMYKNKLTENRSGKGAVLSALLNILGSKSHETEDHSWRLQKMTLAVGEEIGLPSSELDRLSLVAALHDIGKISISEEILMKSGKLTEKEREVMKTHPERGYRIVSATEGFAHVAKDILHHHEKWDGTGYPEGLEGENIPILSRITTIVDAYDAMTNNRTHNPNAKSHEEAIVELQRCAGSQFDPNLVEALINIIEKTEEENNGSTNQ